MQLIAKIKENVLLGETPAIKEVNTIPLFGSSDASYQGKLYLDDEVDKFLNADTLKVLLIVGYHGSGKSFYTRNLESRLWQNFADGAQIPLRISLSRCKNPVERAVEETLCARGLNEADIETVRTTQKFVLILDGYDELRCSKNLFVTNQLSRWKAKVIFTCRQEYLYLKGNPKILFSAFENRKPSHNKTSITYINPFTINQIENFLTHAIQNNLTRWETWEEFNFAIQNDPVLSEMSRRPLLLKIIIEHLSSKMTNAAPYKYYEHIFYQWFMCQAAKLKSNGLSLDEKGFVSQCWSHAVSLAKFIAHRNGVEIYYDPNEYNSFDADETANPFVKYLDPCFPSTQLLQTVSLLSQSKPQCYMLWHHLLVDFFCTREVNADFGKEVSMQLEKKDQLSSKLYVTNTQVLQFLADRIGESEDFKNDLLQRVRDSKNNPENSISAANALTALVMAGITFNGEDLSNIQVGFANLSGGYFDRTNFSGSNLSGVIMNHVWLRQANFDRCILENVNFGEYPWLLHKDVVESFDYSENVQRLAATNGSEIVLWDMVTASTCRIMKSHKGKVTTVSFSSDGQLLASGSYDHTVHLWDINNDQPLFVFQGHEKWVKSVDLSKDGVWIASGSNDRTVRIWDIKNKQPAWILKGHEDWVNAVRFSPNSQYVVSGSQDNTVRVWFVQTGEVAALFPPQEWCINCVSFSPDSKLIASGSLDKNITIWNLEVKEIITTLEGHEGAVYSVQFNAGGRQIISASEDNTVRVWDISNGQSVAVLRGAENEVKGAMFCEDGQRVVAGGYDKKIRFWDIAGGKSSVRFRGHSLGVNEVLINSINKFSVTASADCTLKFWTLQEGHLIRTLKGHNSPLNCCSMSQDGKLLISGSEDGTAMIWNLNKDNPLQQLLRGHKSGINCVAISHDNQLVATCSQDKTIRLWKIEENGRQLSTLKGHNKWIQTINFSPNGQWLVSGSNDASIRIWEVESGEEFGVLTEHSGTIHSIRFNQDGTKLISCGGDKKIKLWDFNERAVLHEFEGHQAAVLSAQFCDNDQKVLSASEDNTLRLWDMIDNICLTVIQLRDGLSEFSYTEDGILIVGYHDGSVECWENLGQELGYQWQLRWSTDRDSRALNLKGLKFNDTKGLSDQNSLLLEQHSAISMN